MPTLARVVGALIFLGLYFVARARYRPSAGQQRAALVAGIAVGLYDWIGEVVLYRWGVWHYQGGLKSLTLGGVHIDFLNVPMEMPLGFVACGMAICFALLIPERLRQRGVDRPLARLSPRQTIVGVFLLAMVGGALIDSTYNPWSGSVVYDMPHRWVMAYVIPFWLGGAAVCLGSYASALRLLAPGESPVTTHD